MNKKNKNHALYTEETANAEEAICLYHCPTPDKPCDGDCDYFKKQLKNYKKGAKMYLEIIKENGINNTFIIIPVTGKDEASELVKVIMKYHADENISIKLKEKGKIIKLVEEIIK